MIIKYLNDNLILNKKKKCWKNIKWLLEILKFNYVIMFIDNVLYWLINYRDKESKYVYVL